MRILVTGGSGSLGTAICKRIANANNTSISYSRTASTEASKSICGDLNNLHFMDNIEEVIHCASALKRNTHKEIIETNILGTNRLCNLYSGGKVKLISSVECFNDNLYGISKKYVEQLAEKYGFHCIRFPTIIGTKHSLVAYWLRQAANKESLSLYSYKGVTKKKFFLTLDEAVDECLNTDGRPLLRTPECKVFDTKILAEVISNMYGLKINTIPFEGNPFEYLRPEECSLDFPSVSHEELLDILTGLHDEI